MIDKSLGPYKIIEMLGAGGMGEVYLGEDTRLGRKVAIKVLPAEFASDAERLARFELEARASAALNHPHIAAVFDVGSEAGDDGTVTHYMVQEYLEGETLRSPLDKGALQLGKALDLAIEISEALGAAHAAGIIHRDLKPENVFITKDGHAKVLDFGLAKLTELATPGATGISMSPTVLGTVAGQVMGTAGYMAPEQVEGEGEIDARADLFAFGCVLYEMAGGKRAFGGKSVLDTLHAIARTEPQPLGEIRPDLPAELQRILRKCLAKDPDRRYQTAGDVTVDVRQLQDDVTAGVATSVPASDEAAAQPAAAAVAGIPAKLAVPAAIVLVLAATAATYFATRPIAEPQQVARFDIELPNNLRFAGTGRRTLAISPDGSRIVFNAGPSLWLREVATDEVTQIRNTEGARSPFFSPRGDEIGFAAGSTIQRVPLTGGAPIELAPSVQLSGASWAEDGTIFYAQPDGIYRVVAAGGSPAELVVEVDAGERVRGPQLLPGGEWLLFTSRPSSSSDWGDSSIVVQSLTTRERHEVIPGGSDARYLPSGHIVYGREGSLIAVAFDPRTREVSGATTSVVEGVRGPSNATGAMQFAVSDTGSLIYWWRGAGADGEEILVWVDVDGNVEPLDARPANYLWARVSPDGAKVAATAVAVGASNQFGDTHVYDLASNSFERRTYSGHDLTPVWSPDGAQIAFSTEGPSPGDRDIHVTPSDGSGDASLLLDDPEKRVYPLSWAENGTMLVLRRNTDGSDEGLYLLDPEIEGLVEIVDAEFQERHGRLSPDGAWLAYSSDDSGENRVFVRKVPGPSGRTPVSRGRGTNPVWSEDGRTIYYMGDRDNAPGGPWELMWAADVQLGEIAVVSDDRRPLFDLTGFVNLNGFGVAPYDIDPVTGRFLMARSSNAADTAEEPDTPHIKVVLNWFEELRAQVPAGR